MKSPSETRQTCAKMFSRCAEMEIYLSGLVLKRYVWQKPNTTRHIDSTNPTAKRGCGSIMSKRCFSSGRAFVRWSGPRTKNNSNNKKKKTETNVSRRKARDLRFTGVKILLTTGLPKPSSSWQPNMLSNKRSKTKLLEENDVLERDNSYPPHHPISLMIIFWFILNLYKLVVTWGGRNQASEVLSSYKEDELQHVSGQESFLQFKATMFLCTFSVRTSYFLWIERRIDSLLSITPWSPSEQILPPRPVYSACETKRLNKVSTEIISRKSAD